MKIKKKAPLGRGSIDPDEIESIVDKEGWGLIKEVMDPFERNTIDEQKQLLRDQLKDSYSEEMEAALESLFEPDREPFT